MLYYFFALMTAAVILIANDYKSETSRWAAFFLFCASIGGTADFFRKAEWELVAQAAQFLNLVLTPYGVLVFSIVYSERITHARTRNGLKLALLIPPVLMSAGAALLPDTAVYYRLLLVWAAPYYLLSCYLLIVSLVKENNRSKKRNRFITTIIIVPTLLAVLTLIYLMRAISPEYEFFQYISLFIVYSLAAALLFTFVYGVLGVKLRFERDPLESAMKAASSGANVLNHTIKNEIAKIALSTENLKRTVPEMDETARAHLQLIAKSSEHMLAMVTRIHSRMKDIILQETPCRLDRLADESLVLHRPLLESHGIRVQTIYSVLPTILCDPVHIKEVIGNLITNAAEAMPGGGTIEIRLISGRKGVLLSISDTGSGIPSDQLAHLFEPFYSTKNRARNFGLGLSYVYNVMQRSGGSVEIASRENTGTTVTLHFSADKTVPADRGDDI